MTTRLGLTGGIGSGKSHIARWLTAEAHIPVYDCDREAKRLIATQPDLQRQLDALCGGRPLAEYLFASDDHARRVAAIVHPAVRLDFRRWTSLQAAPLVALESAILYESRFETEVDRVLYVDAPLELRIQRAMARDHAPRPQILARIARQRSDEARRRAHYTVLNDGRPLEPQLRHILHEINNQTIQP